MKPVIPIIAQPYSANDDVEFFYILSYFSPPSVVFKPLLMSFSSGSMPSSLSFCLWILRLLRATSVGSQPLPNSNKKQT
ncbi:hypothetical protein ARMGADRAFT_218784 [Armillaria gallica]|uniref:Uncharacterized protein n=1 Tax=Armillaria gallica TaxID=47427 RepID=A0A2H3DBS4_ARMGA|nr:hypothetical protein ARMGADRAFT_218784 [Armillaria gallica]